MKSNRFYLACYRENTGTNASFHRRNRGGYSTDLNEAMELTYEEAVVAWRNAREYDQPLCADRVDALTVWHVDCQYIPFETHYEPGCTQYVAFQSGRWNGNDVYWIREDEYPDQDFLKARIYEAPIEGPGLIFIPFAMADKVKRRTIDVADINHRKMVQAAGLTTPEHIKRYRRRSHNAKTRWNCPSCGRLAWQYETYDFVGCSNIECDEWRLSA